jgi:hypothetical protein
LHYTPLNVPAAYPIGATYANTAPDPTSPWVMPGTYQVRLTVNGTSYTQSLEVKMDPRVKISDADIKLQHDLSLKCYEARKSVMKIMDEISEESMRLKKSTAANSKDLDDRAAMLQRQARGSKDPNFARLENIFATLFGILHGADMAPTLQTVNAVKDANMQLDTLRGKWTAMKKEIDKSAK